ncbi:hypothetical protein HA387_12695 [Clavibacter michiganensis subsp. michiganensis]|uniref:hypothetical protein n=1 Tax=Clavibacter michiganensis TaxID=28447 RepID=UPI001867510D|nr:hypothetical protein [Clavibacter michiganensis]MBE3079261.1 hypothetical protein [Clavibacter michiganensis subsp. michiganensis]
MREYDSGERHEAKRIATTLRVLMHDTDKSTSLLKQLNIKTRFKWIDSSGGVDPNNLLTTSALTTMGPNQRHPQNQWAYHPRPLAMMLATGPLTHLDFTEWWTMRVIKDDADRTFTRRQLILISANKEGGGHVGDLTNNERALKSGKHFGWQLQTDAGSVPLELAPIPPSVRTIATEVDLMFSRQAARFGLRERDVYVDPYDN